jgi:sugar phosphate isomerase/epimerase
MTRIGIDLYSLRSQGWNAFEFLEYCSAQGVNVVHFSEIRFLGGLDPAHLRRVREAAQRLGLEVEIGMGSICPSSNLFDASQGTAEEQLARMIEAAATIGSPMVRAVMGNRYDRSGEVALDCHIENTIRVLRAVRSRAIDAGISIAMENHGGDLRAVELKHLIEEAGTDFVGACVDSGNMPMTLDVPLAGLETLAPYVLTSHVRDSEMWRTPCGVAVRWVPLGEGSVDIREYLRRYMELCPGRAITIEMIRIEPRCLDCLTLEFWSAFRQMTAEELARYLALAERGREPLQLEVGTPADPAGCERRDLEACVRFAREFCGGPVSGPRTTIK